MTRGRRRLRRLSDEDDNQTEYETESTNASHPTNVCSNDVAETRHSSSLAERSTSRNELGSDQSSAKHHYNLRQRQSVNSSDILNRMQDQRRGIQPRLIPTDTSVTDCDDEVDSDPLLCANASADDDDDSDARDSSHKSPKRARVSEPKSEDEQSDSDNDGFVVRDDEVVDADDLGSHTALRNKQIEAEDSLIVSTSASVARTDLSDTFALWIKHLLLALLGGIRNDLDPHLNPDIIPTITSVEDPLNFETDVWVVSSHWRQTSRTIMFNWLCLFPDCRGRVQTASDDPMLKQRFGPKCDTHTCSACQKTGCVASYIITLSGTPYHRNALKYPFDRTKLLVNNAACSDYVFQVGCFCYQRLRLFHAMYHFKLRTMLSLRSVLEHWQQGDCGRDIVQVVRDWRPSLVRTVSSDECLNDVIAVSNASFDNYNKLRTFAVPYAVEQDTRKILVNTSYIDSIYRYATLGTEKLMKLLPARE